MLAKDGVCTVLEGGMVVLRGGFASRSTMRVFDCCVKRRGMNDYKRASD